MLWLDSTYPTNSTALGASRGSCSLTSGVPSEVEKEAPDSTVVYSNIRFGPIGSTFDYSAVAGGEPSSSPLIIDPDLGTDLPQTR